MAVRRKRKPTKQKKVYPRIPLEQKTDQYKWVGNMVKDQMFMKLLENENRAYYNIVKSTWKNMSYSSAPIVRRNLKASCEKYREYDGIVW